MKMMTRSNRSVARSNDAPVQVLALLILGLALCLLANAALASGGGNYGQDNSYKSSADKRYEAGKSAFYARDASGNTILYCVRDGDRLDNVTRRSLKSFAGKSADELTASLVRCDNAEATVTSELAGNQVDDIVYYLNKRYKLSINQS